MDIFWAKSWKIGQNQFFGRGEGGGFEKKWGTNKIEEEEEEFIPKRQEKDIISPLTPERDIPTFAS